MGGNEEAGAAAGEAAKMSSSTIRKALGAVKDQTSIGLAKVTSNIAPELDRKSVV